MTYLDLLSTGPMVSIQDAGRQGVLRHGLSASGPMDHSAYRLGGQLLDGKAGAALEFGPGRLLFRLDGGPVRAAFTGGRQRLRIGEQAFDWNSVAEILPGAEVEVTPGEGGNFGYVRFDRQIDVPELLGSRSTNLIAGIGGLEGRTLRSGDRLELIEISDDFDEGSPAWNGAESAENVPLRVLWGIHADLFATEVRERFVAGAFTVSTRFDRMAMRLDDKGGIFKDQKHLSLVSDVVIPGDIQILGDGTPIVLMRDHQPTGGYPRIATVIGPDLDRLAQMRPRSEVRFAPVTVEHAQRILAGR